jgi:RNA polymerase sigma-70 factor (ECF subfamily)
VSQQGAWSGAADIAMERYATGDDAAFGDLYDLLYPRLLGFLRRRLREAELAEDFAQQTFLQMHRARGHFMRGAEVAPWAFAIARNLVADAARRRRIEPVLLEREESDMDARPTSEPGPDDLLHARRVAERIEQTIALLPATQRIAFELIKQDGLSLSEAAEVLGTTVTAVKLRAHRAYASLRSMLGELEDEGARR